MPMNQLPQKKKRIKESKSFGEQEVDFSKIFPLPEGFEKLFLTIYFITIPYVAGLLFLFIFVAKGDVENFLSLDIAMFVAVWAIGYEVVASIALIIIFYKMFSFSRAHKSVTRERENKSKKELYEIHDFS